MSHTLKCFRYILKRNYSCCGRCWGGSDHLHCEKKAEPAPGSRQAQPWWTKWFIWIKKKKKQTLSRGGPKLTPSMMSVQMVRMAFLFFMGHRAVRVSLRVTMSSFLSGTGCHSHLPPQVQTLPLSCLRRRDHSVECWSPQQIREEILQWFSMLLISRESLPGSECWPGYVTDPSS